MTSAMYCSDFWRAVDKLAAESEVVIDRPKGSRHPRFPHVVYPLDYGYLDGTSASDRSGIDLWRGSIPDNGICGIIVTVDLMKRDSEIKLLFGLTGEETAAVLAFHNDSCYMKGILVPRPTEASTIHPEANP